VRRCPAVILLAATSLSCTQIPKVEPYVPNAGIKTCNRLAKAAADRSAEEFLVGTAVALVGAVVVGTGIAMGPGDAVDAAWYDRSRNLLVIAPSAMVAAFGIHLVGRSQQSDTLADQSVAAIADGKTEEDQYLYYECVSARAAWSGDSREMIRVQVKLLQENLAAAMAAQQSAAAAEKQAQVATTVAVEAKATAARAAQIASASAEATKDLVGVTEKLVDAEPRNRDGGAAFRDAGAALSAAKANLTARPDAGAPRPDGPALKSLDQR